LEGDERPDVLLGDERPTPEAGGGGGGGMTMLGRGVTLLSAKTSSSTWTRCRLVGDVARRSGVAGGGKTARSDPAMAYERF
jgi:hypothetical protein